jgi:hypothetical protein
MIIQIIATFVTLAAPWPHDMLTPSVYCSRLGYQLTNNHQSNQIMSLAKFQTLYPEVYAEVFRLGVLIERAYNETNKTKATKQSK